ncbi:MAG: hypothetical protein WCG45_05085 [bacterium]
MQEKKRHAVKKPAKSRRIIVKNVASLRLPARLKTVAKPVKRNVFKSVVARKQNVVAQNVAVKQSVNAKSKENASV